MSEPLGIRAVGTLADVWRQFAGRSTLSQSDRLKILLQAEIVFRDVYVNLIQKRASYGIDPVQRIRMLRARTEQGEASKADLEFHKEIVEIFRSVRDLHVNYILPAPWTFVSAILPFQIECIEGDDGQRIYVATSLVKVAGFEHPEGFREGVQVLFWNALSLADAVSSLATHTGGSNDDAFHARGVASLTVRPFAIMAPPTEKWVNLRFLAADGIEHEARFEWIVFAPADMSDEAKRSMLIPAASPAIGMDVTMESIRQIKRAIYSRTQGSELSVDIPEIPEPLGLINPILERSQPTELSPTDLEHRVIIQGSLRYGYIRLRTFKVGDEDEYFHRFIDLLRILPDRGLIIDLRDNPGGSIEMAERLLQLFTPNTVVPTAFQFSITPLTLDLCEANAPSANNPDIDFGAWLPSVRRSAGTGALFSDAIPISRSEKCNDVGQIYFGPVVIIVNALCYSAAEMFAAGFQDHHIGVVLGTDRRTGAGGANVWAHEQLCTLSNARRNNLSSLHSLASMTVPMRRCIRVGAHAGLELEGFGVSSDIIYRMTRIDLLEKNSCLIDFASSILSSQSSYSVVPVIGSRNGSNVVTVATKGVSRLDWYVDGRPGGSENTNPLGEDLTLNLKDGVTLELDAFEGNKRVVHRRMVLHYPPSVSTQT